MRVSLIKDKQIQNVILPRKMEGTYWISGTDSSGVTRNLISIDSDGVSWKLNNNKDVYIKDTVDDFTILSEYKFYELFNEKENVSMLIYCSPIKGNYDKYRIDLDVNSAYAVGSNANSVINFPSLQDAAFYFKNDAGQLSLINNNSNQNIYINDKIVNKTVFLAIGDVIFICGMKIIFIGSIKNFPNSFILGIDKSVSSNIFCNLPVYDDKTISEANFTETDDNDFFPLFDETAYFHKIPRFITQVKTLEMKIELPPAKPEENESSLLLTIGPMISMSMISVMTGVTALSNVYSGGTSWSQAAPSIIISLAMLSSVIVWPFLSKRYTKKANEKKEIRRQEKYIKYIDEKRKIIRNGIVEQTNILRNNYPSTADVANIIIGKYVTLWQRRVNDYDFLDINLGSGIRPMDVNMIFPEEGFSLVEDSLKEQVYSLNNEKKELIDVPIVLSLKKNFISGLIGHESLTSDYVKELVLQLAAFHSYDDLKIIFLTDEENKHKWSSFKNIPHCFTDNKNIRFFAINASEYNEVCYYLDKIYKDRENSNKSSSDNSVYRKSYLIITDSLKKVRELELINSILSSQKYLGFSLFIVDQKITDLPDKCSSFVQLSEGNGLLYDKVDFNKPLSFKLNLNSTVNYEYCSKILANIPIEILNDEEVQLSEKISFLEMYDVGKVEQLNASFRWEKNNPVTNLAVPIGIGKNEEIISIDLHEKYHGPHGLIAGMTGSGKSEFIISYILSAAVNYHPYEVQFVLIDYKGGGLAGAFENKNMNIKLPHLVGSITNLDVNEINRSLLSIESELKRRQQLFNKARELSSDSTIDIYKYQKMYRNKLVDEPISHLFIISDEFAELKVQQPEFMNQLISTARIGRSLGVHLILATQKPTGVVDPQIWSNSRFKVCMKVQDKSDSNEIIKIPDAAYLKQTGRFYFQVGYNEVFLLGQAAWAGEKYVPSEKVIKNVDSSIDFINNIGVNIKNVETKQITPVNESSGEELNNILVYLDEIAKKENIKCKPLWLEKLSAETTVEDVITKYNFSKNDLLISPVIGEYDIPSKQMQSIFNISFSENGNAILYGAAGSGKEKFIETLISSSFMIYDASDVNYYIIDFGSGALKIFEKCPLVGDILTSSEEEKIENLFKLVNTIIEDRKKLLQNYGGNLENYRKSNTKKIPDVVVIINNFDSFQESYEKYEAPLSILSRNCQKYGVFFLLTVVAPNAVKFKLKHNFAQIYSLQQNNIDDYTAILGTVPKKLPSKVTGNGIFKKDEIYEFQVASIKDIKELENNFAQSSMKKAISVPVLPEVVDYLQIKDELNKSEELIIGINKRDLEFVKHNFKREFFSLITAIDIMDTTNFVNNLINQILIKGKDKLIVINAENYDINQDSVKYYKYCNSQFDQIIEELMNLSLDINEQYANKSFDKTELGGFGKTTCIIIGLEKLISRLNLEEPVNYLEKLFKNLNGLEVIDFILVESLDKVKKLEIEPWFKNVYNNMNAIWFGNGISEQFTIKLIDKVPEMKIKITNQFCFVIQRGIPKYVKCIEHLDIK